MNKISGFILFIIAQVTTPLFNLIGMIYACFRFTSLADANRYYKQMALSKDQHSNVVNQYFFNDIMIKNTFLSEDYNFGNEDETISSVFGKNQRRNTLTWFGMVWNKFLNGIEKDHSILSIEEDETND